MATVDTEAAPDAKAQHKHRSAWVWVSVVLGIAVIGLLIWALTLKSDRDDAQQQAAELQAQVDQADTAGGAFVAAARTAFDALTAELGATQEDLAAIEQSVQDAKLAGQQAADDASAAADRATAAVTDATAKAQAQADQARAELQAAESKATIAADCAKAYTAAFGSLFDGENVRDQAAAVRTQLQGISADCKAALSGGQP
jgi:chromosome segregation ATPase